MPQSQISVSLFSHFQPTSQFSFQFQISLVASRSSLLTNRRLAGRVVDHAELVAGCVVDHAELVVGVASLLLPRLFGRRLAGAASPRRCCHTKHQ
ncbi:hypothetical protein L6452_01780 [Arctium lappa]|uniref:Uncharacterized protein n=1 Tax=Arctium lappa TaxID=4217 RepID=A0ACB9FH99_ARCLA|nr:hypothetical protein L6452_01780 [Arctium lappa]